MIAASFLVFLSAVGALFFDPLAALLLWLLSVGILFTGLMTKGSPRGKVINLAAAEASIAAEAASGPSAPFQENGGWYMWDQGILMAYNERFESWYPAAASARVRPHSLLPENLVSESG